MLEQAYDPGGHESGAEVQRQPGPAGLDRLGDRGEHVFFLADPPHATQIGVALLIDQVHHFGDGEPPHQLALAIHHGGRDEIVPFEGTSGGFIVVFRVEGNGIPLHDVGDQGIRFVQQQSGEGQLPLQPVAPVGDEQLVGVGGDLAELAQVALHRRQAYLGAHRDQLEVHHGADRVLAVADHLPHPVALVGGHGGEQPSHQVAGQVLAQIDLIVDVEAAQGLQQRLVTHAADQAVPHRLRRLDQDLAVALRVHLLPEHVALVRRQGLQGIGDVGGRQAVDQARQLAGLISQCGVLHPLRIEQAVGEGIVGQQQGEDAGSVVFTLFGAVLGGERHATRFLNSVGRMALLHRIPNSKQEVMTVSTVKQTPPQGGVVKQGRGRTPSGGCHRRQRGIVLTEPGELVGQRHHRPHHDKGWALDPGRQLG